MEAFFELIQLAFLFVEILDESSSPLLHFVEPALKSLVNARGRSFNLSSVLRMPHVVSDELFDGFLPLVLQVVLISHQLELTHESVYVLNEDVVPCDQHFLLLALTFVCLYFGALGCGFVRSLFS